MIMYLLNLILLIGFIDWKFKFDIFELIYI